MTKNNGSVKTRPLGQKQRMDRAGSLKETSGAKTLSGPDRLSKPGLWEQTPYPARISDGRPGHNKQRLDRRTTGPTVGTRPFYPRRKQCLQALAGPAAGRGSLWTGGNHCVLISEVRAWLFSSWTAPPNLTDRPSSWALHGSFYLTLALIGRQGRQGEQCTCDWRTTRCRSLFFLHAMVRLVWFCC